MKYPAELMLWLGIMQRIAGFRSNNEFEACLNSATDINGNLKHFVGKMVDEIPSIDDLCYFLQRLDPEELHKIRRKMLAALERKKFLKKLVDYEGYLLLAIDGVQTFSSGRPIEHSTYREHSDGKKTYHQYFLEAKIVCADGFVLSLDSEPIENPTTQFDKQDCETKAAIRLLRRVQREHPHLKFRILGDALYCNSVIMDMCDACGWKYSFTFKGLSKHPTLLAEIENEINWKQRGNRKSALYKKNKHGELHINLRWCNNLKWRFGASERSINYIAGEVVRVKDGIKHLVARFAFLLSEPSTEKDALKKFMTCRERWKIENQGFNFQKNNILHIGRNFSSIGHAGHNYYLLAQIAHTIIQLAYYSDIAGYVRRQTTKAIDQLSQTLKSIFKTFAVVAWRIKVELLEKEFKPPILERLRVRLKFA